jgi:hypothetical protein
LKPTLPLLRTLIPPTQILTLTVRLTQVQLPTPNRIPQTDAADDVVPRLHHPVDEDATIQCLLHPVTDVLTPDHALPHLAVASDHLYHLLGLRMIATYVTEGQTRPRAATLLRLDGRMAMVVMRRLIVGTADRRHRPGRRPLVLALGHALPLHI